jgi:hypothetical protein
VITASASDSSRRFRMFLPPSPFIEACMDRKDRRS